jgi:hypothetical protein
VRNPQLNFLQKLKQKFSKLLNLGLDSGTGFLKKSDSGSGTGSGFENFPKNRVLGSGSFVSLLLGFILIDYNHNWPQN